MRWTLLALVLPACTSEDTTCDHTSDGSYPEEGVCEVMEISPSRGSFDELIITSSRGAAAAMPLATMPRSPAIENGATAPTTWQALPVYSGWTADITVKPTSSYESEHWTFYGDAVGYAAVALSGGQVIGGGWSTDAVSLSPNAPRRLGFTIDLDPDPSNVEIWGAPRPSGDGACLRLTSPAGTAFFVRDDDSDCDGIVNDDDCRPFDYCDPNGTPAEQAGCTCPG